MRKVYLSSPVKALVCGNYSYYPTTEQYEEAIADTFYPKAEPQDIPDDRTEFYHDFFAYQEGWAA